MKKIVYIIFVALLTAVTGPVCGQHTLGNIPEGWKVKANGDSVPVVNGTATITAGATVVLTPPYPAFVKSVTLTDAPAPVTGCRRVDLSQITADSVIQDCDTLTGTLAANVKISIAAGAIVTLDNVTINGTNSNDYKWAGITCEGNATLILKDDTTNTVKGFHENYPGIYVPENSTLTIQGETSGTGKLIASSNGYGAGIGGGFHITSGSILIEGGIIETTGGMYAAGIGSGNESSCGAITISGGNVTATGGSDAAGIGSGNSASCDTITITGGTIEATGGYTAAGIGSGYHHASCSAITISGGNITATGGYGAAGIGSGYGSSCDTIAISGGNVIATGGSGAAGIGSAWSTSEDESSCGNITITGGTVNATGGNYAAGIGSGKGSSCGAITITSGVTRVTATSDAVVCIGYGNGDPENSPCGTITFGTQPMYDGSEWTTIPDSGQTYGGLKFIKTTTITDDTWELTCRHVDLSQITADSVMQDGDVLTETLTANVKISIAAGATVTLDNASINAAGTWTTGNYAGITCLGDATIILSGTNTVKGFYQNYPGIQAAAGKTLTINGTGSLTASTNNGDGGAGIGAGKQIHCGNIEIQNGTITANGGQNGAGIGGGFLANCGNITISGGTVMATGGYRAAGIGGGTRSGSTAGGNCGNITISGGTVTATGGEYAAGIGGGRGNNNNYKSSCGTITIANTVTKVTATMGSGSTNSIGAGKYCNCGTVTIGGATGAITTSPYTYPAP